MHNKFIINESSTIKQVLIKIDENKGGFVLVCDSNEAIIGLVTDGDLRSKISEGISIEEQISNFVNREFVWANPNTPREVILKKLDNSIRFIPLLDDDRKLIDIVTRYHLPLAKEEKIYARAKAPVRVSFGGGGSDLTHYFLESNGAVINSTISLYCHTTLFLREDNEINIYSHDLKENFHAMNFKIAIENMGNFRLILSVIKILKPDYGFDLFIQSDFPIGSGLGGSAVVASSILGCFNEFRRDKWDLYEIAELAYQAERLYLDIAGGWQDQYATVFGGFNFMEFSAEQNIIQPLRIATESILELEECLVLCDTGTTHDSGNIHNDQKKEMSNTDIRNLVQENVKLTYEIRNQLLRSYMNDFGKSLDKAWNLKKRFSSQISNSELDVIYHTAIQSGALGGKLLGAGGGGFFLFYVPAQFKHKVIDSLKNLGKNIRPFRFEEKGLQTWTVRENSYK
jgi:D-glycero-alpha-D-manno-heptose-7-phosphate kinase